MLNCGSGRKSGLDLARPKYQRLIQELGCVAILLLSCLPIEAQSVGANTQFGSYIDVGGVKLWYEECGAPRKDTPSVVLLHDGLLHSVTWDGVWAPLCTKYHVLRYDRRGYGKSEPAKSQFVPENDLYEIMHRLKMDRAILVGNSSGGGLAIDFALAHPEATAGLFLIGPVVHGMATSDYFSERGNRNNSPLAHGDVKATAENWSHDRFLIAGDDPGARKQIYECLSENPQNLNIRGGLEVRPVPPSVLRLSEIRVPTLVLVGDADIADVFAYSGAIEAAVTLSSFEVWKDTGHLIQLQHPAELVSRFNRFVALTERKEAPLTEQELSDLVGHYKLLNRSAAVALHYGRLVLEVPGDPYYWLFAASKVRFFLRTDETEIEFQEDAAGTVVEMIIHNSDGTVIRCPRVKVDTLK